MHSACISAVSSTLPPASRYRLIIVSETESSTLEPNSAVPRQSTEASRLVRGTNRVLIGYFFFAFFEGLRVFQIQPVSYRFPVLFRRDWLCPIRSTFVSWQNRLAWIAHKSFEICERSRLRQRNSPAPPELWLTRVCVQRSRQQTALETAGMCHCLSSF